MDQKFWADFAANYWEKKALHLKNSQSVLSQINEADIFNMLVKFADRCRKKKDVQGFKFFIHGFKASDYDVLQVLPVKKDKSLQGYHQRMNLLFKDYCLVCDDLLHVSEKHQSALAEFTHQMYQHVGFPNRFTEIGLYLGNYRKTPFGVHVDSCGVFSFPVVGQKCFRLWTPEYVSKNPKLNRAQSYTKHKSASTLMKLNPGDMSYWPSCAWHIAESDGSFSATWSLGVWVDREQSQVVSEVMQKLVAQHVSTTETRPMTHFKSLHKADGQVTEMPAEYNEAITAIQKISKKEIQKAMHASWMKHISNNGFKSTPSVVLDLAGVKHIKLANSSSLVLWCENKSKKTLTLSYSGNSFELEFDQNFLNWLRQLNQGTELSPKYFGKFKHKSYVLKTIQLLAEAGAFARA